jgi:putative PIN family toxin of toxin-antitoxin system
MRKQVVCDTNILISALVFPGGNPDKILGLARIGEIDLLISPFILHEFEKVLREKFNYKKSEVAQRSARIMNISRLVEPSEQVLVIGEDKSDNRILECAVAAKV